MCPPYRPPCHRIVRSSNRATGRASSTADGTADRTVHIDAAAHCCVGAGRRWADRRGRRHRSGRCKHIEEKPKARKRGECTGDKKKRACRTCKRCKANKGADGKTCRGRHPCNSSAKCEFFDAVGEKIPAQQDIDEEGGASAKKAAKKYTVA